MSPTDTVAIDPRLKKRMLMFYLAGIFNAVLGVYVNCIPCESDLATAVRAWAEEVDAAAVAAAG